MRRQWREESQCADAHVITILNNKIPVPDATVSTISSTPTPTTVPAVPMPATRMGITMTETAMTETAMTETAIVPFSFFF